MVLDIRLYIITFRDIHMCKMKSLSAVYFVYAIIKFTLCLHHLYFLLIRGR